MRQRKSSKKKAAKQVFLVICEGETEANYVDLLRRHYRLPITIKTKISGNQISKRLVDQYIAELGVSSKDEYQIFYIYDMDISSIVEKLKLLSGITLFSNPCIELWFLLHISEQHAYISSRDLHTKLCSSHPHWKNYLKGKLTTYQQECLLSNVQTASQRAKSLSLEGNPSTNLFEFIEILEGAKWS